jgi:hypothetical protein
MQENYWCPEGQLHYTQFPGRLETPNWRGYEQEGDSVN